MFKQVAQLELAAPQAAPAVTGPASTRIAGVVLHRLPHFRDFRGSLSVAEAGDQIPFEVKRFFLVAGVSSAEIRGEHAHRALYQPMAVAK